MSQASTGTLRALRAAPTLALLAALSTFWIFFHSGARLAFTRVAVRDGRVLAWSPAP